MSAALTNEPARRRVPSAERREQFLDVAARLVAELGVDAVTMERVARVSDVNRALIYRFFPNRDQLLVALSKREWVTIDEGTAIALEGTTNLGDKLKAFLSTYLHHVASGDMIVAHRLSSGTTPVGSLALWQHQREEKTVSFLSGLVRTEYPRLPTDRALILATTLSAGMQGLVGLARAGVDVDLLVSIFVTMCVSAADHLTRDVQ